MNCSASFWKNGEKSKSDSLIDHSIERGANPCKVIRRITEEDAKKNWDK